MPFLTAGPDRFHYVERGSGRPLLLVHGFPLDYTMWTNQLDVLSRHCRLIAPDLRGFGRSVATDETVTMEQYADDLAALLDALCWTPYPFASP
jgi:3-oxoadipate enol-lactonase